MRGHLSRANDPRMPPAGIEPMTSWLQEGCSNHSATAAGTPSFQQWWVRYGSSSTEGRISVTESLQVVGYCRTAAAGL